jgi:hypothetical protein
MLNCLSGRELTQWQVYENINGPLDNSWRDEQLATLLELLQQNTSITGAAAGGKKNPAPKPQAITRPWQLREKAKEEAAKNRFSDTAGGELILEKGEVNPWQ